jgi:mono/diheme cytochrome c family protein
MRVMVSAVGMALLVPALAGAQDAARGEQVFVAQKCSMCHQVAGKGNKLSPLDGVGKKLSAADTKEWIVDPDAAAKKHASTKKPAMPKTYAKLPAADVDAMVAYLQSLK